MNIFTSKFVPAAIRSGASNNIVGAATEVFIIRKNGFNRLFQYFVKTPHDASRHC